MKKAIELLEDAYQDVYHSVIVLGAEIKYSRNAMDKIEAALAELKAPSRFETPEQREERTGEPWPDDAPVYFRGRYDFAETWNRWKLGSFGEAVWELDDWSNGFQIVCATEAGPPPEGWRPEE
jgi:hypothetical protein